MFCPSCHKTLPTNVRFCAYCGTDLGWRLLPGLSLPRVRLPPRWQMTGGLAALLGGVGGAVIGLPLGSLLAGAFVGALGLGASAMFGEVATAAIPDRRTAERFGQALGALGGALVAPGGLLTGIIVTVWIGGPHVLKALGSLAAASRDFALI